MSDKSTKKRKLIIERARDVFASKGFTSVTMKDIVQACDISRGGLYLYFSDTSELFLEVLKKEREGGIDDEIEKADTSVEMLSAFLREQKKEILGYRDSLIVALYEYYFHLLREKESLEVIPEDLVASRTVSFDHLQPGREQEAGRITDAASAAGQEKEKESADAVSALDDKQRFEMSTMVLERLIRGGIDEGYLECEDPRKEALNIMFALEGLKICAVTIGITPEEVAGEINYLFSHLFAGESEELHEDVRGEADLPDEAQDETVNEIRDDEEDGDGSINEAAAGVPSRRELPDDYYLDEGMPDDYYLDEDEDENLRDADEGMPYIDLEAALVAQTMRQLSKENR